YPAKFDYIIIHETGHEWWGNSLSIKDLADMWIHEGFCTYTESLYLECMYGRQAAFDYLAAYQGGIRNDKPIIGAYGVNNEGSSDMYPKGAVMLHTLRNVVDDDKLWFATIKSLLEDFKYKTTSTDELVVYMNKKLGKDYTYLFNQYLRFAEPPMFVYSLWQKGNQIELTYRWKADVKDFKMPLKVGFGKEWQVIEPKAEPQKILLNGSIEDFKIATDWFYIKTQG
ncbi:MAG: M1 family peptidase, partial [Verrucomicrobia bacterium]|nr:M1 family peptidase [Cytophagales bacterium]